MLNKFVYSVPINEIVTPADNLKSHEKNHSFWDRFLVRITESCIHRSICHETNISLIRQTNVIDKIHDFAEFFFKLFESKIWFLCHIFIWIDFESYRRIELRFTPKESSFPTGRVGLWTRPSSWVPPESILHSQQALEAFWELYSSWLLPQRACSSQRRTHWALLAAPG